MSGQCFCPFRTPERCGNHEGHGTPLPFRAELLLAAAARGIGVAGASCGKTIHRVSHLPKALGAPGGAVADMTRGERAGADRVAQSKVLTRRGPVTWGRHLRQPRQNARALGQRARRHYWLAPRSDDAIGAAVLGQGAAELQHRLFG